MIVLSSPATLTGAEEKKTGPSRFRRYFSGGWVDANYANRRELKPAVLRETLRRVRQSSHKGTVNEHNVSLQYSVITLAANGWHQRRIARELDVNHKGAVGSGGLGCTSTSIALASNLSAIPSNLTMRAIIQTSVTCAVNKLISKRKPTTALRAAATICVKIACNNRNQQQQSWPSIGAISPCKPNEEHSRQDRGNNN